jgi:hypothetical protein
MGISKHLWWEMGLDENLLVIKLGHQPSKDVYNNAFTIEWYWWCCAFFVVFCFLQVMKNRDFCCDSAWCWFLFWCSSLLERQWLCWAGFWRVLIMDGRSMSDKRHVLRWREERWVLKGNHVCCMFFWGLMFMISYLLWDGKNAQLEGTWSHHFEVYKFFYYMLLGV